MNLIHAEKGNVAPRKVTYIILMLLVHVLSLTRLVLQCITMVTAIGTKCEVFYHCT
jgi:hypothetical protein